LVDEITEVLCHDFGYRRKGNGHNPLTTHSRASLMTWQPSANGEVPKPLYHKVCELMPNSRGIHRRRVIGLLRDLVPLRDGRNEAMFNKAAAFRKAYGPISDGIITYKATAKLLLMTAQLNGYVARRGEDWAKKTILSGLGIAATSDARKDYFSD
jgi:hypothetical protein